MRYSRLPHCGIAVPWGALPGLGWWGPWVAAVTRAFITFLNTHGPPSLVRSTILQRQEVIVKASRSYSFLIAARPPQLHTRAAPVSEVQLGKMCFFSQGGCRLSLPQGRGNGKLFYIYIPPNPEAEWNNRQDQSWQVLLNTMWLLAFTDCRV